MGLGPQRGGSSVKMRAFQGQPSFPEFFNENFCDVLLHFFYRLIHFSTYFDLI